MPCPFCGDICRCSSNANCVASPLANPETPGADAPSLLPAADASLPDNNDSGGSTPEDSQPWRQEVAARLSNYQARRKRRPPRYPSLQLRFEEEDHSRAAGDIAIESSRVATASNHALALDRFADCVAAPNDEDRGSLETGTFPGAGAFAQPAITNPAPATAPTTAKIIEFPRSWTPPQSPLDELAEPVWDRARPRILEAPEVVPPPPALGGITIEPAQQPEMERRPGIDIPLQSAPLARRILSAAVDGVIIAAACALFGFIFWKLTAIRPPRFQMMGLAAGLSGLFWAAYQYLLLVYSGTTPGLRLARLELARFDGRPAGRRLRRWRVLASFLSAASLGMGYSWVFLDEDSLCWHDRITHTHLAPRGASRPK
jgi:uncharacterized RDD family membrane protein YckC